MNKSTGLFELLPCYLNQIILEGAAEYIVSIIVKDESEIGFALNNYDGSMLSFVDLGCAENSHINIIHQLLLKFKKDSGFDLKRIIIEAKYGDVIYCRLHWHHKKQDIFNICSIGDALILNNLTGCDMFITKSVFEQFDEFDSQGFMESFENP